MNVKTKHCSFVSLFSAFVHALSESFAGISLLFRSKSVVHTHHASKLLNFLCFNFFSILVSFMYIAKYWRRLVCAHLWSDGNTRSSHTDLWGHCFGSGVAAFCVYHIDICMFLKQVQPNMFPLFVWVLFSLFFFNVCTLKLSYNWDLLLRCFSASHTDWCTFLIK